MSIQEHHQTAAADRVPWGQLVIYGMGGLIPIALFNIAGQLMGLLGNISLGLSAVWLGTVMIIPKLWDAISDPIVGHLSDNTRTSWGRRRPYILIGGIATALTFVAMWWVPRGDWVHSLLGSEAAYNWFQLVYILAGLLLFFTATTVFEIPHGALGMEMSSDYHERTRLFSAKSFLGNLFAMGTPWLLALATHRFFSGTGGDLVDGMRQLSVYIAAIIIPLSIWWFIALKEPGFAIAKEQQKTSLWQDLWTTMTNSTFLKLVAIIFTLAMGFNFVGIFNYYITIFYIYGGDTKAAAFLLGLNGTVWAVTGLVAVFPLNWLSRRFGKSRTLLVAILLMCCAQLSKIYAYDPDLPYLALIPTVLLSAGMLMFFTLGASMVGDVCDEDELRTGFRSEGSYFAVYWWFIKMGTALASFVMGVLLVYTGFDERQSVAVESLAGSVAVMKADAKKWASQEGGADSRAGAISDNLDVVTKNAERLRLHFTERIAEEPDQADHVRELIEHTVTIQAEAEILRRSAGSIVENPADIVRAADLLHERVTELRKQTPTTLFRLRLVEIGLPLLLSCVSIGLTLGYPLTESRCYEIKAALKKRHAAIIEG